MCFGLIKSIGAKPYKFQSKTLALISKILVLKFQG